MLLHSYPGRAAEQNERRIIKSVEFEELKSLDLRRCATVGDIVDGMRRCAFGARMLGEVARTIHEMVTSKRKPVVIDGGLKNSALGLLLQKFVKSRWCARIVLPSEYAKAKTRGDNVIVVGAFSERNAEAIYKRPARAIFINPFDMARPGQIKDGYFPDAVFADPRYIMPVIHGALKEWIDGEPSSARSLIANLAGYGGLAEQVARGAKALGSMISDKNCCRFLTVSGAMTVGKMDLIICDMIESGMIHAISSTGALMAHGLVSSIGLKHYKYDPKYNDTELARRKLNRVTDTLEPDDAESTHRQTFGGALSQRPWHSEIRLSARRARLRSGVRRLRVGQRSLHPQLEAQAAPQAADTHGPRTGQQEAHRARHRGKALWDFFHRRRRAAQQRAKRRAADRDHQRTAGANIAQSPVHLWHSDLSRQAPLRPPIGVHLLRKRILAQSGQRRRLRRDAGGCHSSLAVPGQIHHGNGCGVTRAEGLGGAAVSYLALPG